MRGRDIAAAAGIALVIAAVPLIWPAALAAWGPKETDRTPSYLPAVEKTRARRPFDPAPIEKLRHDAPNILVIGDSMAGRVDPSRLEDLLGGHADTSLVEPATGPGRWYLAFKNWVVPSGIHPTWIFVFFRDTNLTDTMFRLLEPYRGKLDFVARDREPELNALVAQRMHGAFHAVYQATDRLYQTPRTRAWLEPQLAPWLARLAAGSAGADKLTTDLNEVFDLKNLRSIVQADMQQSSDAEADFNANIGTSVLPAWVDLARQHDMRIVFVKVLRRPVNGQPPPEKPSLQRYERDLREWLEARGMIFIDDRDIPGMAALPYADGDHLDGDAMTPYADLLIGALLQRKPGGPEGPPLRGPK